MSKINLREEFTNCKRFIDSKAWSALNKKLNELSFLKTYSNVDESLLSYARNISDFSLKKVIRCGVDPDIAYSDGATMLMDYSSLGNVEMVRFLIEYGSDVNKTTSKGESAISFACAKDQLSCAKELYQHGANLKIVFGPFNTTLLDVVDRFASREFREWLITVS